MQNAFAGVTLSILLASTLVVSSSAQEAATRPSTKAAAPLTMTGCVSQKPGTAGQYVFQESESVAQYRLNGKNVKKFAGQKVEIVIGSTPKVAVRGGLWPSPNVAAQGGGVDAAQESIARQPGGGATGAGVELPELRITTLKGVQGACD